MRAQKNKRGERGSIEEETSPRASKKLNMASESAGNLEGDINVVIQSLADSEEEPSLLEIKSLLLAINRSINCSVSSLLSDNKALRRELKELKDCMNFNNRELKELKESLQKTNNENKALKASLDSTNEQLKPTKEKLRNQTEDIVQLWDNFDNLEQYTRKNSIEIQGIPEDAYSSKEDVVIKVAEALNITVEPEDIEICHKLRRGKGIIAKFVSHKTKSSLYKKRTQLKNVKIKDLFPGYPSTTQRGIFINENLTTYRRRLLEEANRRRRDGTLLSVWTMDGKMFVKTSPDGRPIRIFSEVDLDNL